MSYLIAFPHTPITVVGTTRVGIRCHATIVVGTTRVGIRCHTTTVVDRYTCREARHIYNRAWNRIEVKRQGIHLPKNRLSAQTARRSKFQLTFLRLRESPSPHSSSFCLRQSSSLLGFFLLLSSTACARRRSRVSSYRSFRVLLEIGVSEMRSQGTRRTHMCKMSLLYSRAFQVTSHITLALHMTWKIARNVSNYTILHMTRNITVNYTDVSNYTSQLLPCWLHWQCCPTELAVLEVLSCRMSSSQELPV